MKIFLFISIMLLSFSHISADYAGYDDMLKDGIKAVNNGQYNKAEEIFQRLVEKEPQRPEALCAHGIMYLTKQDYNSAKEMLRQAEEVSEEYGQVYYLLGMVKEKEGDISAAERYFKKYLELEPETDKADRVLMRIEYMQEKME